jgi:hypothetical protein
MSCSISKRIIKPKDCAFITALPLCEEDFYSDIELRHLEFPARFGGWRRYDVEVGSLLRHVIGELKGAGVAIHGHATLKDFGESLQSEYPPVVMLMAHWNENGIEFSDGFAGAEQVLDYLPIDRCKFIDLAVCHPEPVMESIRKYRPHSIAHGLTGKKNATPDVWLRYFSLVLYTLKNSDSTYLNASEMAFKGLLDLLT